MQGMLGFNGSRVEGWELGFRFAIDILNKLPEATPTFYEVFALQGSQTSFSIVGLPKRCKLLNLMKGFLRFGSVRF